MNIFFPFSSDWVYVSPVSVVYGHVLFEMFSTTLLALNIFLYPSNRIFFGHAKERQMNTCKRITDVKRPLFFFPTIPNETSTCRHFVLLSMCWFSSSSCSLSPLLRIIYLSRKRRKTNCENEWKRGDGTYWENVEFAFSMSCDCTGRWPMAVHLSH